MKRNLARIVKLCIPSLAYVNVQRILLQDICNYDIYKLLNITVFDIFLVNLLRVYDAVVEVYGEAAAR